MSNFCPDCGTKINPGDRFCTKCGKSTTTEKAKSISNTYNCPKCGAIVMSFSAKCPYCDHEFRDMPISSSLDDFVKQLQAIDLKRTEEINRLNLREQSDYNTIVRRINKNANQQKNDLIRNYTVPNTKEAIYEFMIMASSNIICQKDDDSNDDDSGDGAFDSIANSWITKMEQVYNKASLTLSSDSDFAKIENIYKMKKDYIEQCKITKEQSQTNDIKLFIKFYIILMVVMIIGLFMLVKL